ncbi:Peptidyl-dipeptidase A precursor [hydrothermal vent metagenome]|uniref:Peptidyl-dipeptidase A n=1 Tax=hydrothermal vent metagenome TaxID=652676 RepID=A0A3B0RGU5_9ZZZZ
MKKLLMGVAVIGLLSCSEQINNQETASSQAKAPSVEEARKFIADSEKSLQEMGEYGARIAWVNANFITDDTDWLATKAGAEFTKMGVNMANDAKRFNDLDLPPELARKMKFIKIGLTLPAPSKVDGAAEELSEISTWLGSTYAKGEIEMDGQMVPRNDLEELMGTVRNPEILEEMWTKWREVSVPMGPKYARLVEIGNAGAKELGFEDLGELWLSGYDMQADEMAGEVDRLWGQVKPLYDQLHCYVRAGLNEKYGDEVQAKTGPIRADLLGNMWAQGWSSIYPIVAPKGTGNVGYDVTELLKEKNYTPIKMVETGENFFSSLGLPPLPDTFWKRSLFTKPQDRDVVCHASAWDLDGKDDIRIKMCTKVNDNDFQTVHHELGHNYYQRAYKNQPVLFQSGAHDGFHEAIGDFIGLSITPRYLADIGLITEDMIPDADADTGLLLNKALDKIAFLPFAYMMDNWRWQVFSGDITPEDYNKGWWELRTKYQGITPPGGPRPADAFDPGSKYHIPGNTPYLRYFLSYVVQFQFHQAACKMSGWEGPLHRCSIYGSDVVGEKFQTMLEMGQSQPWPDALEAFTGSREMDGSAIVAYFEPLMDYLKQENKGSDCGWE